jgi:hypothetical protein
MATSWHGMPPSRPRGCGQAKNQKMDSHLQVSYCIMYTCVYEVRIPLTKVARKFQHQISGQCKSECIPDFAL